MSQRIDYDRERLRKWYDDHAEGYDDATFTQTDERYAGDVYRVELVARLLDELDPRTVLDVGCGTAEPLLRFLRPGRREVQGFDLSPGMVAQAKRKLAAAGLSPELVEVGDVLDPGTIARYPSGGFDVVLANGVLPYIEDDRTGHRHLASLVRPGGHYIGAYSNAMFDMFTFNRFTTAFFERYFIAPLPIGAAQRARIADGVRALLARPDEPRSIPEGARDEIYVRSHNPMTIGEELRGFGLAQRDILFYKWHAFPPLVRSVDPELDRSFIHLSRSFEVSSARDWRGHFQASTFIVLAQKG